VAGSTISDRPDLIADRYDGLAVGPSLLYSFETQVGVPIDNGNAMLRDVSPFTIRIIPPELSLEGSAVAVDSLGHANQSTEGFDKAASAVRGAFGGSGVTGAAAQTRLSNLQQIVSAGQILNDSTSQDERATLVDQYTAADIAYQIERILQTSPLTLLVNPNSMSVTHSPVQQYQQRGRYGFVFERWGETQPTVSFSGSTGAFIAGNNPNTPAGNGVGSESDPPSGLQYASKRDSAAWQNFMALYHFYRNNGYIYDTLGESEAMLFVGALAIDYDQMTYVGHINSFSFSYQEETAHRVEWEMEFTVDRLYDNAVPPVAVMPMMSPTPTAAYAGRPGPTKVRPESPSPVQWGDPLDLDAGDFFSGQEQFDEDKDKPGVQVPLDLFFPSGVTG
jgi:hypothetical protein